MSSIIKYAAIIAALFIVVAFSYSQLSDAQIIAQAPVKIEEPEPIDLSQVEFTSYGELLASLESIAKNKLEKSEVMKQEFVQLQKTHGLASDEQTFKDFVRVRMIFEATRDSGLWQLRWAVTDKEPNSDSIWNQWKTTYQPKYLQESNAKPTAIAECDEISALFALIVRGLGVKNVGLFWPTWNHTVAVWKAKKNSGEETRIVIPTTQVFLSKKASLGTKEFDPYKQKNIYNYERKDIKKDFNIPSELAKMMIQQVEQLADKPSDFLQKRRNQFSKKFNGS